MSKLYQLAEAYHNIEEAIETANDAEQWSTALAEVKDATEVKICSIAAIVKNLKAEYAIFKAEADRLAAHARAIDTRMDWLKVYIKQNMEKIGITKTANGPHKVRIQDNSIAALVVTATVPAEYMKVTLIMRGDHVTSEMQPYVAHSEINNTAIRDAIDAGIDISFARLEKGDHIVIS